MAALDLLRDARQDAALAVRQLARRPGFALVALLTLALGIGAPTAIFSVVRGVLLRPLPYADPDRVVTFRVESDTPAGPFAFDAVPVSDALEWAATSRTLAAMSVYNDRALSIATVDGPVRLNGISATPALFDVLGAQPRLGHVFGAGDTDLRQIVLADDTWRRYYAAAPGIVGQAITLDGQAYRVTGVMPRGFGFPTAQAAFWVPQALNPGGTRGMALPAVARLARGVAIADVVAEGTEHLASGDPQIRQVLIAQTLKAQMVGAVSRILWVLLAAVVFVAAIATVNIALLLLTRGAAREREFAIRLSLGAGRARLARQLFVEGGTLAALGGLAGIALAAGGLNLLLRLAPADLPRVAEIRLDGLVLAFAVGLTFLSSLVFGLLSAGRLVALDALRQLTGSAVESRLVVPGPSRRQVRSLAAIELALTTVLLVGAGLLLRSFVALVLVPQGFEPRGALAFGVSLPAARYPSADARMQFLDALQTRLRTLPGVASVGVAADMPNRQPTGRFEFSAAGVEMFPQPFSKNIVATRMVGEGFFDAMGLPILAGRGFTAADADGADPVIVISRLFASQQFGDASPIGRVLYSNSGDRRVIGVVADVHAAQQDQALSPSVYLPLRQQADLLSWHSGMNVVVRGAGAPPSRQALAASVRAAVLSLDPQLPTIDMRWLSDEVAELTAGPRFSAVVLSSFAAVALIMASLGVYGVMGFVARQRTREIGVRQALGATRQQVLADLMRDAIVIVVTGLATGLVAAVWLARTLTGVLHEVTPADPVSLVLVGAALATAGLVAGLIPARRATRINLLSALRED